jgi:heterodisulfide reductase subunit C
LKTKTDTLEWKGSGFLREVERRSGTDVGACYQCHKCSTGCPIAPDMELLSSQVMRLIHLGDDETVLGSKDIWLCASCEACTTRCPMQIDIAAVMDTLRIMAVERKADLSYSRGEQFNRSFLGSVRRNGRVYELGMMTAYKIRSGDLFTDAEKTGQLMAKGKLSLLPKRSAGVKELREAFRRSGEEDKKR